jgi:hypothetical protein
MSGRAYILEVLIVDRGDKTIKVGHEFFGLTEKEVRTYYREHVESCEYFKAAVLEGRTIETLEEVDPDELPDADDETVETIEGEYGG